MPKTRRGGRDKDKTLEVAPASTKEPLPEPSACQRQRGWARGCHQPSRVTSGVWGSEVTATTLSALGGGFSQRQSRAGDKGEGPGNSPQWLGWRGSPGLSLVSPNHGGVAGMDPTALKLPHGMRPKLEAGWDTNPNCPEAPQAPLELCIQAAPNLSPRSKPSVPNRNLVPQPPVPLGHTGDSPGQVAQPRLVAGPPRGTAATARPAAQGLARSPRDIFILAFVLFEDVGSVFSLINTTLPWPHPGSELTGTATPSAVTA